MKKKIPYIISCIQCPAYRDRYEGSYCTHSCRFFKNNEQITIPDWCPLPDAPLLTSTRPKGVGKVSKKNEG